MSKWQNLTWLVQHRDEIEAHLNDDDRHGGGGGSGGRNGVDAAVGDDCEFNTIQAAHDSLGSGWTDSGLIFVSNSYDPGKEDFPIHISRRCSLRGSAYANIVNNDNSTHTIVIDITDAPDNRPPGVHIDDLSITGGRDGIHLRGARYCVFTNLDVNNVGRDAYHIEGRDWGERAVNSHHFYSCHTDNPGRDGFHIGMRAHGVRLYACQSYFAGRKAARIDHAVAVGIFGGSFEQATEQGIYADGSRVLTVKGAYLEANATDHAGGAELHVTGGAHSVSVENCYFNGFGKCQRAVRFYDGANHTFKNCEAWNYTNSVIHVDESAAVDWHRHTHDISDDTPWGSTNNPAETRSGGMLIPQDLRQCDGQHDGDCGIHRPDGAEPIICLWYDGNWYPQREGGTLGN